MTVAGNDSPAGVKIKICGITCVEDGLAACEAGADYLGYVFYPKSVRNVAPEKAAEIIAEIRGLYPHVLHTGVFVNEPCSSMAEIARIAGLDVVQLHGDEPPDECAAMRQRGYTVVKVLKYGPNRAPSEWKEFPAEHLLCDTHHPTIAGGTGAAFDHSLLPGDLPLERVFLAGGLTAENVRDIINRVKPYAVDVSSAVEASPGRKSATLIRKFIQAVRNSA